MFDDAYVTRTPHVLVIGDREPPGRPAGSRRRSSRSPRDVRRVWPERTWNGKVVAYAVSVTHVRPILVRPLGRRGQRQRRPGLLRRQGRHPVSRPGDGRPRRRPDGRDPLPAGQPEGRVHRRPAARGHARRHRRALRRGAGLARRGRRRVHRLRPPRRRRPRRHAHPRRARAHGGRGERDGEGHLAAHPRRGRRLLQPARRRSVDERYNSAFITCLYIADHYGEATLRRLYEQAHTHDEAAMLVRCCTPTASTCSTAVGAYAHDAAPAPASSADRPGTP